MPGPGLEIENNSLSVSAGIAMTTHSYASNSGDTDTLQNLVLSMPQQDTVLTCSEAKPEYTCAKIYLGLDISICLATKLYIVQIMRGDE